MIPRLRGSRAEAEDAVQDAFLRWIGTERAGVREPAAFLVKIVAPLCLDRLRARRREACPAAPGSPSRSWRRTARASRTRSCRP